MPMNIADVKPVAFPLHGDVTDKGRGIRIAILAEGFVTNADLQEFRKTAAEVKDYLLQRIPFRDYLDRFALVGIECRSKASARQLERDKRRPYDNMTPFDATFDYVGMPGGVRAIQRRISCNITAVRNVAQAVYPRVRFDIHVVIVNSTHYGGEAVPGDKVVVLTLNDYVSPMFVHELGHALAGLTDEYEYWEKSDAPTRYAGNEVTYVNAARNVGAMMKWWDFLSNVDLPSTDPDTPAHCSRDHDAKVSAYEDYGIVGAFEGAMYHSCDMYRPSYFCCMRTFEMPFCPVCANHIRRLLVGSRFLAAWSFWPEHTRPYATQTQMKTDGRWTHVVDISGLYGRQATKDGLLLLYDTTSGLTTLLKNLYVDASLQHRSLGGPPAQYPLDPHTEMMQTLDTGWMTLTTFSLEGDLFFVGTRFDTGLRTFVKVLPQNSLSGNTFQPLITFDDPDGPWTHVVAFELGATTFLLSYNYFNGRIALDELDDSMGVPYPNRLASYDWEIGWNHVVVLNRDGRPLIAMLNSATRVVQVVEPQRPDANGLVLNSRWSSNPGFLPPFVTHSAGIAVQGQPLLITHAIPGVVAIHSMRATGRPLLDFNERRAVGFGPSMLLGTGAPAMGGFDKYIWLYGTAAAEFRFLEFA